MRSARSRLRPSWSSANRCRSGSSGSGAGDEVEQVERAAGRRGEVGGDRRHDRAGGAGHEERRVGAEGPGLVALRGLLGERRRSSAGPSAWPTSTAPGRAASRRSAGRRAPSVLRLGATSTALTVASGRSRASALAKPVTAPPERRRRAGGVVAVASAEPGAGDEEGARAIDLLGQRAHGDGEQLHADAHAPRDRPRARARRAAPRRRAPAASRRRGSGRPRPGGELGLQRAGVGRAVDREDLDAALRRAARPAPRRRRPGRASARRGCPAPSWTPVGAQTSSGGRSTGTGTRRG